MADHPPESPESSPDLPALPPGIDRTDKRLWRPTEEFPEWEPTINCETRSKAWKRLDAEGRWEEFREHKKSLKQRNGEDRLVLFYRALKRFPPLTSGVDPEPEPEPEPEPIVEEPEADDTDTEEDEASPAQSADSAWHWDWKPARESLYLKDGAGRESSYEDQVRWVSSNFSNRKAKPTDAPCNAGWELLKWAKKNENAFFSQIAKAVGTKKEAQQQDQAFEDDRREQFDVIEELEAAMQPECPECGTTEPVKCTVCGKVVKR